MSNSLYTHSAVLVTLTLPSSSYLSAQSSTLLILKKPPIFDRLPTIMQQGRGRRRGQAAMQIHHHQRSRSSTSSSASSSMSSSSSSSSSSCPSCISPSSSPSPVLKSQFTTAAANNNNNTTSTTDTTSNSSSFCNCTTVTTMKKVLAVRVFGLAILLGCCLFQLKESGHRLPHHPHYNKNNNIVHDGDGDDDDSSSSSSNKSIHKTMRGRYSSSNNNDNVLVISTAPRTVKHVVALWSELECFTTDVGSVLLSGPIWSGPILQQIVDLAKTSIPRFRTNKNDKDNVKDNDIDEEEFFGDGGSNTVQIEYQTFVNDRYDVGLWCDALQWLDDHGQLQAIIGESAESGDNAHRHDAADGGGKEQHQQKQQLVGLLNDSVFALREYSSILSSLTRHNVSMTSLSYSLYRPHLGFRDDNYWLESIWRGFDPQGLRTFRDYSCRPKADDPMYCSSSSSSSFSNWLFFWRPWQESRKVKNCIVENFERNLVRQYEREKVMGLFPSDVPSNMVTRKHKFLTWVRHEPYWKRLVEEQDFPVSKVNWPEMIDSIDDDRLETCTKMLREGDRSILESIDFSAAASAV